MSDNTLQVALSIPEAMKALRMSRQSLYREITSGRLRTYCVGRRRYISTEAILKWVRAREAESEGDAA